MMETRLVIDGNAVYETDEACLRQREGRKNDSGKGRGQNGGGNVRNGRGGR